MVGKNNFGFLIVKASLSVWWHLCIQIIAICLRYCGKRGCQERDTYAREDKGWGCKALVCRWHCFVWKSVSKKLMKQSLLLWILYHNYKSKFFEDCHEDIFDITSSSENRQINNYLQKQTDSLVGNSKIVITSCLLFWCQNVRPQGLLKWGSVWLAREECLAPSRGNCHTDVWEGGDPSAVEHGLPVVVVICMSWIKRG